MRLCRAAVRRESGLRPLCRAGHRLCASTCPAVFTLEDGVAVAMAGDIPEEELPAAAEARDGCPVSVIDIQAD